MIEWKITPAILVVLAGCVCRDPDPLDTCRRYWQNHHARLHRGDGRLREARRGGRHAAESLIGEHAKDAGNREEESAGSSDRRSRLPL